MINDYLNAVRNRIEYYKRLGDAKNLIVWDVQPDESIQPGLLSYRVYGTEEHTNVVNVACGVSGVWEVLPQQRIALLQPAELMALRREYLED